MKVEVFKVNEEMYMVNTTAVTVYRDMEGDIMTNPRLMPDRLAALRNFISKEKSAKPV